MLPNWSPANRCARCCLKWPSAITTGSSYSTRPPCWPPARRLLSPAAWGQYSPDQSIPDPTVPGQATGSGTPASPTGVPASPTAITPPPATAAAQGLRAWEIHPSIGLEETYTDNVRLGPAGTQRTDW